MKKLITLVAALTMTACSTAPINKGFIVESVNTDKNTAVIMRGDMEVLIEFDARYFKDGDGYQNWRDVEIKQVTDVVVNGFDDEEDYQLSFDEVSEIVSLVESKIREEG